MARRKREKIAEIKVMPNVFEEPGKMKGNWKAGFFGNSNPIVLELGCGKGEYTVTLAQRFPEMNFIGMDIKGPRIWKGARTALDMNLANVAFIRSPIEMLQEIFVKGEVSEIWITFPDPYPKVSKEKKRLVSPRFLAYYREILEDGGIVHFKTDNDSLFNYALEVLHGPSTELIAHTGDLYNSTEADEITSIKTTYEKKFLEEGKTIKYLKFRFTGIGSVQP